MHPLRAPGRADYQHDDHRGGAAVMNALVAWLGVSRLAELALAVGPAATMVQFRFHLDEARRALRANEMSCAS